MRAWRRYSCLRYLCTGGRCGAVRCGRERTPLYKLIVRQVRSTYSNVLAMRPTYSHVPSDVSRTRILLLAPPPSSCSSLLQCTRGANRYHQGPMRRRGEKSRRASPHTGEIHCVARFTSAAPPACQMRMAPVERAGCHQDQRARRRCDVARDDRGTPAAVRRAPSLSLARSRQRAIVAAALAHGPLLIVLPAAPNVATPRGAGAMAQTLWPPSAELFPIRWAILFFRPSPSAERLHSHKTLAMQSSPMRCRRWWQARSEGSASSLFRTRERWCGRVYLSA